MGEFREVIKKTLGEFFILERFFEIIKIIPQFTFTTMNKSRIDKPTRDLRAGNIYFSPVKYGQNCEFATVIIVMEANYSWFPLVFHSWRLVVVGSP